MSENKFSPELTKAICDNNLILFVGAGLSYNFKNINNQKLMGWDNLVSKILQYLKNRKYDVDHLIPLIGKCEPIKILDLIESDKNLPKEDIIGFCKNFFDLQDDLNDYSLHQRLFKLSKKIITTNYDTSFERSIPELRKNTAYKGKNYELTTHKNPDSPLLFKLHGCYENADTMVLFNSNYSSLYNNRDKDAEHSLLVLKNIIINKSILFIGMGMGDFQINNIFSEIKNLQGVYNQKHFIITKKHPDSSLDFLTPILVDSFSEVSGIVDELLQLKENSQNRKSIETKRLEEDLLEVTRELEKLRKSENKKQSEEERKDRLLQRESLKYFTKGLRCHLNNEFKEASKQYQTSTELNPKNERAFDNWGISIAHLAELNKDEKLYAKSFGKFKIVTGLNSKNDLAFNNWGLAIANLARLKNSESLFLTSFEKYHIATELNSKDSTIFNNWGNALANLARLKKDETIFVKSFEKFQTATELDEKNETIFNNWGFALASLASLKNDEKLYIKSFEKYQLAIDLGGPRYNLACWYALRKQKEYALLTLEKSLELNEIRPDFVLNDSDWLTFSKDVDFTSLLHKYSIK